MRGNKPGPCARCPKVGPIAGRGLCGTCYDRGRRAGDLPGSDRVPHDVLLEEVEHFGFLGYDLETSLKRLHTSRRTLYRAIKSQRQQIGATL